LLTGAMNALTDQETFNAFRLQTAMRCFEGVGEAFFTDPDMSKKTESIRPHLVIDASAMNEVGRSLLLDAVAYAARISSTYHPELWNLLERTAFACPKDSSNRPIEWLGAERFLVQMDSAWNEGKADGQPPDQLAARAAVFGGRSPAPEESARSLQVPEKRLDGGPENG
jgi:hypothetical protein